MFPCNCRPPFPRPEPFSPLPRPGTVPDWGKWIRDRLAEKGALLAFPTRTAFPSAGSAPNLYLAEDTGVVYRWGGEGYAVLVDPSPDVETHPGRSAFPDTGRAGVIYIDASANLLYWWNGTGYVLLTSDLSGVESRLADVESKVPAQATAQNQLADKAFVNSSIATNTAFYISDNGRPFRSLADLENYEGALTNNDYAFVVGRDAAGNTTYTRYKWNEATEAWGEEYVLNNSSFTAEQWAAISSGVTSGLVAKLGALPTAEALAAALAGKQDALTFDNAPTARSNNPVKSGGIWSAIWGALSALPTGFTSLYDWCVAQFAKYLPLTGGTMTGGLTVPNLTVGSRQDGSTVGNGSVAEGVDNTASASFAHAEGGNAVASGIASHAEGSNTTASGTVSHAEGYFTKAVGRYTHAEGADTIATNDYEHAQGRSNASHKASTTFGNAGNTLSSIGFGDSPQNPRNAIETMQDGKTYVYGLGGYDGTNPTSATDLASDVNAKANRAPNPTSGNLAALDADGNPTDSGVAKSDVESLFFTQYYPEGNVKSAAEFTARIKYDTPDTTARTITVKPFCNTGTATNDNSNLSGRIVIPPFVDVQGNGYTFDDGTRYKVVGVSGGMSLDFNPGLTAVVAPSTVTTIGQDAVSGCDVLTSVSFPAATTIGSSTFSSCPELTSVSLPAATNIGDYAFGACTALVSVSLPAATTIGGRTFEDCTALVSVSLPAVTSIGSDAFRACTSLESVSLPAATTIGSRAFSECNVLSSVSLPAVTSIWDYAFYVCPVLASVDFGDAPRPSVPSLDTDAFRDVPTSCKIIVPDAQYDAWVAADGWSDLVTAGYKFLRHSEWEYARKYEVDKKADKPATFTAGNLAALDAQGNPTDSQIPAANVALKGNIPYSLGTPIVIDTASSEEVGGETVNYGAATLADRTANVVQVTAPLDELRITFPAEASGKAQDFGLRVEIGTGSAALAAPALVPIAPTGETIKIENNAAEIPALADGTATAKGVTLLYFSEPAPGVFVVKGEQVEEVL